MKAKLRRGRPRKVDDATVVRLRQKMGARAVAKVLHCDVSTVYTALARVGKSAAPAVTRRCNGCGGPFSVKLVCVDCSTKAVRNGFCRPCGIPKVRKGGQSVCPRCGS